ncbi:MAG: acetaldehyde dehydrogenase (acetylating) [Candidatus Harrisonbacteria bacterium]|nr:acetaldehyde dehydrogenase (acetylating) [Candidatus Harrisonbacteria bacterium]MBI2604074.1 acetaldehyde dehydrogenase (acetylating) [Candidatus Harrisonbacteria bacterium]MBI3114680.1 acetaldehyde dehydrogenase (acetylating) [Candidatus Harrisonbacteria bacterium]
MPNVNKLRVGIIGTGNIGSDLLMKVMRSPLLTCGIFTGRDKDSAGIARAKKLGVPTSYDSIKAIIDDPTSCDIVCDATSAAVHVEHAAILKKLGKFTIDLTPSCIGVPCIPVINLKECLGTDNVNLVTCGGQGLIPIARAVMEVHPETEYIEMVGAISSKSAGPGTRANIEEYIQTTTAALKKFSGVPEAKAILILNPAEPPILMHNTLYAIIPHPDIAALRAKIKTVAKRIQAYVPGYRLAVEPTMHKDKMVLMIEVVGVGDFLPTYAGNLDIMTCAAVNVAEGYAKLMKY